MLVNLHVKNFAIIDEVDVDFGEHLNILTGETGAGKSILVGSIGIALGARVSPEIIGKRADYAMVELVFQIEKPETIEALREMDIEPEDGQIVISRKITANRSINKINGESVPVGVIRKVSALCIDIHGQHEHQSLLNKRKHLEILDTYARMEEQGVNGENIVTAKRQIEALMDKLVESYEKQLDRLFAGALEHAGKIEAEGAAAKQGNIKINLHRLVVEILESVKPCVEVIVLPVSAEPYGF